MIIQFKPVNMDKFTGKFGETVITIERHANPKLPRSTWYIYVDGRRTNAKPRPSPHAAMTVVEHIANKVLYANAGQVPAHQGKLSPTGHKASEPELQNVPVPSHKPGKKRVKPNTGPRPKYLCVDYGKVEARVVAAQAAGILGAHGQRLVGG